MSRAAGYQHTLETKSKMSAAAKRRYEDPGERAKLAEVRSRKQPKAPGQSQRDWRAKNPDKMARYHLTRRLKSAYGMTLDEYEVLVRIQGGRCAICGQPNQGGRRLVVDHDHVKGNRRGLLCGKCNFGLGQFNDSIELLAKAIAYLGRRP